MASPKARVWLLLVLGLAVVGAGLAWHFAHRPQGAEPAATTLERAPVPEPERSPVLRGATDPTTPSPASVPEAASPDTWRITYEVFDADGTPRHHMGTEFQGGEGERVSVHTPEDGPANEGTVEVRGSGYLVIRSYHRVPWVSPWLDPPPLGERHLVVRLDRGLPIHGVLLHPDGVTPMTRGIIKLHAPVVSEPYRPGIHDRTALVQGDGTFRFEGLSPGTVTLRADGYDPTVGGPVSVQAEAGDENVRIPLRPAGGIAFLIVDDATGRALQSPRWAVLEMVGDENRVRTSGSINPSEDPPEARPTSFLQVQPGRRYRFRVEAQGYQPSRTIEIDIPPEGGRPTVRVSLIPAPESVARLTIRMHTAEPVLPTWVAVTYHVGGGSRSRTGTRIEDERVALELAPGRHRLTVGGGWRTDDEHPEWIWVPVDLEVDLEPAEEREVEVWLRRGGGVALAGDPDPRPSQVTFTSGERTVTCHAWWGRLDEGTGYKLAVLAPGTWQLEYAGREKGFRAAVEVKAGEITRLTPEMLEPFTVEAK